MPVFKLVMHITHSATTSEVTDYETGRQRCIELLEQAMNDAASQDVSEEEQKAACLAAVAWLDETILCSELPWRHLWRGELLQRRYLDITVAGERFFSCLAQLEPSSQQAYKVFLFCLQNGFHGQYSTPDNQPDLQLVIDKLRQWCLPQDWQSWPNDAALTPYTVNRTAPLPLKKRPVLGGVIGMFLLYGMLFFLLHYTW
jgi:type VI secretion system protein ImpK